MNVRNEIKAQIIRTGMTMQEVVDLLSQEYGWSDSVSNLSAKLQRESIRYKEGLELADVLGYDLVWQKRRDSCWRNLSMQFCVSPSIRGQRLAESKLMTSAPRRSTPATRMWTPAAVS